MADQATLNGGPRVRINSPLIEGVIGNLAEFGGDITTLAELQAKLAVIDLKEGGARAAVPTAALAASAALALGGLPVLLFGVAELIHQYGGMKLGWALVLTAVVALIVAGIVGAVAALRLSRCFESFRRSREELQRNISWIKTVLAYSGRSSVSGRGR
jgi:uncharacterized membrane protein YqjE